MSAREKTSNDDKGFFYCSSSSSNNSNNNNIAKMGALIKTTEMKSKCSAVWDSVPKVTTAAAGSIRAPPETDVPRPDIYCSTLHFRFSPSGISCSDWWRNPAGCTTAHWARSCAVTAAPFAHFGSPAPFVPSSSSCSQCPTSASSGFTKSAETTKRKPAAMRL